MRVLEIPDMLRKYGVEPVEVAGWRTRGNEFPTQPDGALRHWTVGSSRLGIPSLQVLTYGRSDLPGPLCQVGQERSADGNDRAYVIASGKANHAGDGLWNGIRGNYKLLGLEIEWTGPNEPFSARRRDVSERIMRALLDCCSGTNDDDVAEHREYALPPGRKIDTNLDGNVLRRRMRELRGAPSPTPTDPEDDDMAAQVVWFIGPDGKNHGYRLNSSGIASHFKTMEGLNLAKYLGVPEVTQPLDKTWQDGVAILDGPCRNTPVDTVTAAQISQIATAVAAKVPASASAADIAAAVVKALPPSSTGGITAAQVRAEVDAAVSFLKPGQ